MRDLSCLAQAISRQKLRKLDLLGDEVLGTRRTKLRELYDGLLTGTIRTDREAARILYNAGPTDARWRQLKSRFRKKLLNTLLLVDIDQPVAPDYEAVHTSAQRELTQALLLESAGAHDAAQAYAKTLFATALEQHLPEIILATGRLLLHPTGAGESLESTLSPNGASPTRRVYISAMTMAAITLSAVVEAESLLADVQSTLEEGTLDLGANGRGNPTLLRNGSRLDRLLAAQPHIRIRYAHAEAWVAIAQSRQDPDTVLRVVLPLLAAEQADPTRCLRVRLFNLRDAAAIAHAECGNWPGAYRILCEQLEKSSAHAAPGIQVIRTSALLVRLALDCGEAGIALQHCLNTLSSPTFNELGARDREHWWTCTALAYVLYPNADEVNLSLKIQRGLRSLGTTQPGTRRELSVEGWWAALAGLAYAHRRGEHDFATRVATLRAFAVKRLDRRNQVREFALSQIIYRFEKKGFDGGSDAVAQRHLQTLLALPEPQVLAKAVPAPCRLTDLLPLFCGPSVRAAA